MLPLLNVALSVVCRLANSTEKVRQVFLDMPLLTDFAATITAVNLFVGAGWLTATFLGPRWMEASEILRQVAGPAMFLPLSTLCMLYLTAQGGGAALSIASVYVLISVQNAVIAAVSPPRAKEIWWAVGPAVTIGVLGYATLSFSRTVLDLPNLFVSLLLLSIVNSLLHGTRVLTTPSCWSAFLRVPCVLASARFAQ